MAIRQSVPSRRNVLKTAALAGAIAPAFNPPAGARPATATRSLQPLADPALPSYLEAAREAARWIQSAAQPSAQGLSWLPEPDRPQTRKTESLPVGLYSGGSGVVLYLLELASATGDHAYLEQAAQGADFIAHDWRNNLAANSDASPQAKLGFTGGIASVPFALIETWKATGENRYQSAAIQVLDYLSSQSSVVDNGVTWTNSSSIFSGDSGLLLLFLQAGTTLGNESYVKLARRSGEWLLGNADPDPRGGLRWNAWKNQPMPVGSNLPKNLYLPNFEAGSPGPALALARLYGHTGDGRFLDAARQGALHVQKLATVLDDAALLHYREPDLTNLYYLGLCHGPAGTARAFYELYKATKERPYLEWTKRFARGILASGIPERETPGFWNVVCQCCGSAAVVELFLGLWADTGDPGYLAFADRIGQNLVSRRSNFDGKGLRWYQAWTRVKPGVINAETGYMVGAAGVGSALLHLHTAHNGTYKPLLLPNNPFPGSLSAA